MTAGNKATTLEELCSSNWVYDSLFDKRNFNYVYAGKFSGLK